MMVKKTSLLNLAILFFYVISVAKSMELEWIDYLYSINLCEKIYNGNEISRSFAVDFGEAKIPNHLIIEVNSLDDNLAPTLCFSSRI